MKSAILKLLIAVICFVIVLNAEEIEPPLEPEPQITTETMAPLAFTDIPAESDELLRYITGHGYLNGVGGDEFAPYEVADRATVLTALYRMSGETAPAYDERFSDVAADAWYADAVAWGLSTGITGGVTGDTFAPAEATTRSQLAIMLARFAAYSGCYEPMSGDLSTYPDSGRVDTATAKLMRWAIEHDMYRMTLGGELLPDMPVSRLQLAGALAALDAVRGDVLAAEIVAALPERSVPASALDQNEAQLAVTRAAEKYGAVGVQVAVIQGGAVTDTFACGWATKNISPMTARHKLRTASLSKVAVGMAAMLLQEEGVVSLDESIGTYWGMEVKNPYHADQAVSLRTLLTHTSSIVNAGDGESLSYDRVCARLKSGFFSRLVPGSTASWSYNNYAFGVLGMTLELAANKRLSDVLDERLFAAMNIDGGFYGGEVEDTGLLTTLYRRTGAVALSVPTQKGMFPPSQPGRSGEPFAGGLTISAEDLGKLVALLAADGIYEGVRLMGEDAVALMETVFSLPDGSGQGMPLRCRRNLYGRDVIYYHTGSAYGVYSTLSYDPATGDGVVVLTTGASGSRDRNQIYRICSEISQYVYGALQQSQ